jgi:hypothetical protein
LQVHGTVFFLVTTVCCEFVLYSTPFCAILAAALGKVLVDQALCVRTDGISFVLASACISFTLFRCLLDCSMLLVHFSSLLHRVAGP